MKMKEKNSVFEMMELERKTLQLIKRCTITATSQLFISFSLVEFSSFFPVINLKSHKNFHKE